MGVSLSSSTVNVPVLSTGKSNLLQPEGYGICNSLGYLSIVSSGSELVDDASWLIVMLSVEIFALLDERVLDV